MHFSDDIANLFSRFGGSAESYREIEPSYDYTEETTAPIPEALSSLPPLSATPLPAAPPLHADEMPATVVANETLVDDPLLAITPIASVAPAGSTALSRLLAEIEQQREGVALEDRALEPSSPVLKAKVIAVVSSKGGVGKSTLVGALASAIKRSDGHTLAVDLDPQNALCLHLGGNQQWPGIAQVSLEDLNWHHLTREGFGGSQCLTYGLVSEQERLAFEHLLADDPHWLGRHLASMGLCEQDTVILDTPPGATVYLAQALAIADIALVVTLADAASYTSLDQMDRLLAPYLQRKNPAQCKVVINQLDTSRQFSLDMCEVLKKRIGHQLLGVIRQDHFISESLAYDRNPLAHIPSTRGCQDTLDIIGSLCELLMQGTQESYLS